MKRQELEIKMRQKGIYQIDLIINENDKLAVYCTLSGGKLKDYTNHVIDRKKDLWGYLYWKDGKSYRVKFREEH